MAVCQQCYCEVNGELKRTQDPASGPFVLGGFLMYPIDVCGECHSDITQGFREQLDEDVDRL